MLLHNIKIFRRTIMRTRQLGTTDLELTTVGLGTWAMGGPWEFGWGPQDDNEAIAAILAGINEGVNWIDTAAVYGCGHSENYWARHLSNCIPSRL